MVDETKHGDYGKKRENTVKDTILMNGMVLNGLKNKGKKVIQLYLLKVSLM